MYTRPYRWIRKLKPRNIIGFLGGYASCGCGNTLWGPNVHGYATSQGDGRLICGECFAMHEQEIRKSDHAVLSEPYLDPSGMLGVLVCTHEDCEWHRSDPRFDWVDGHWNLKPEVAKEIGSSLRRS